MPTKEELEQQVEGKTKGELIAMLQDPDDWLEETLSLARAELARRNVDLETELAHASEVATAEAECKATQTASGGALIGITLLILFAPVIGLILITWWAAEYRRNGYTRKAKQFMKVVWAWVLLVLISIIMAAIGSMLR